MYALIALGLSGAALLCWIALRKRGRGKPFPVRLSGLIVHPVVEALSRISTTIDRADVKPGMGVLDAGCGPGRVTIPLARHVLPDGVVMALDLQEGMLAQVRERAVRAGLTNIRTVCAPLSSDTPIAELQQPTFDRAILVTVLGEVPDPTDALRTLYTALKPRGVLSVTEILIDPDYISRETVIQMAADAGFRIDRQFGNLLMFTVNFRKPT